MLTPTSADSTCSNGDGGERAIIFQGAQHSADTTIIADIPPPLRSGETLDMRKQTDSVLDRHWRNSTAYYSRAATDGKELTYGELTALGVRQLVHSMGLDRSADTPTVFVDIGSGAGKMVVQLYLENTVDQAIGIEKCPTRHRFAVEAWRRVREQPSNIDRVTNGAATSKREVEVELLNQDARFADYSAVTHVFMASLCFPEDLTNSIITVLLRDASSLRMIAALSDLPPMEESLWKKSSHELQTSWGSARLRIYRQPDVTL